MPRLKNGAVPSLHLPALSHDANLTHQQQVQVQAREARLSRRAGVAPVDDTSVDGGWDGSGEDTPSSEAGASSGLFLTVSMSCNCHCLLAICIGTYVLKRMESQLPLDFNLSMQICL